tara:strand:- start:1252 stop:1545 length:294 start_codon:yes stop_codon:yes gene_type:complete
MFNFISTPSHGYLMVSENDYRISGYKASRFSYHHEAHVYLEEDCDAGGFMEAVGLPITHENTKYTSVDYDITENLTPISGTGFISPSGVVYTTSQEV